MVTNSPLFNSTEISNIICNFPYPEFILFTSTTFDNNVDSKINMRVPKFVFIYENQSILITNVSDKILLNSKFHPIHLLNKLLFSMTQIFIISYIRRHYIYVVIEKLK